MPLVNRNVVTRVYISVLFLLMMSNGVSGVFAALGIRGIAFYHIQMLLIVLCGAYGGMLLLRGRIRINTDHTLVVLVVLSMSYTVLSGVLLLRFGEIGRAHV